MKKIIFSALLLGAINSSSFAQNSIGSSASQTMTNTASNQPAKYWYYPSQDVYQNSTTNDYWYYDKSTTKWVSGNKLPDTYNMKTNTDRYEIDYNGSDVWKENKDHKMKYKVKSDGTVEPKPAPIKP